MVDQFIDRTTLGTRSAHQVDGFHQVRSDVDAFRDGAVAGFLTHQRPVAGSVKHGAADRLDIALAALEQVGNDVRIAIGGSQ
ncbi:hypothetical protein D3C87_1094090 [compost metagenome]